MWGLWICLGIKQTGFASWRNKDLAFSFLSYSRIFNSNCAVNSDPCIAAGLTETLKCKYFCLFYATGHKTQVKEPNLFYFLYFLMLLIIAFSMHWRRNLEFRVLWPRLNGNEQSPTPLLCLQCLETSVGPQEVFGEWLKKTLVLWKVLFKSSEWLGYAVEIISRREIGVPVAHGTLRRSERKWLSSYQGQKCLNWLVLYGTSCSIQHKNYLSESWCCVDCGVPSCSFLALVKREGCGLCGSR